MKGKKAGSSGRSTDLTMADRNEVEQLVEKAVSQVLESHVPQMREELVRRVLEELPQANGPAAGSGDGGGQPAEGHLRHPCGDHPKRNFAGASG